MARPDDSIAYGTPYQHDPTFKGPFKSRSCTDILCLILFLIFLGVWVFIGVFAYMKGDINNVLMPVDSDGRKCGVDSEVLHKPYLFYFDLTKCASPSVLINGCDTPQVCVKECPSTTWHAKLNTNPVQKFSKMEVRPKLICKDDSFAEKISNEAQLEVAIRDRLCAEWYVASQPIWGRCLPTTSNKTDPSVYWKTINEGLDYLSVSFKDWMNTFTKGDDVHQFAGEVVDDLKLTWRQIVISVAVALVVSLVYIALLRWIAGIMTWLSLLAIVALLGFGCFLSWKRYEFLKENPDIVVKNKMLMGELEKLGNTKELFLVLTIICGIIGGISLLLIIFLRKRIVIAIALIKEGSKAVGSILSTLIFPVFPWTLSTGVLAWTVFVGVYLNTVGHQVFKAHGFDNTTSCLCLDPYQDIKSGDICDPKVFHDVCHESVGSPVSCKSAGCHFYGRDGGPLITYFQLINVFGFFWGVWFVIGLSQMTLAGAFAKWYWTYNKRDVPFFTVTGSLFKTVTYHLGTIAFGSLIISICSFIRAMIEYTEKKIKQYENSVIKAFFCCLKCFFWCLEKFLKFINRNAYIMCAIHGKNFCRSAKDAFQLLMRNVVRVVVLDKVTDFLFFVGKLVIAGSVVAGAYFGLIDHLRAQLHHFWAPLVIIFILAYIIASVFFSVYSMAVDTLFLCFLEDCERNDGSPERPYFMSKELMKILGKKNKKLSKDDM